MTDAPEDIFVSSGDSKNPADAAIPAFKKVLLDSKVIFSRFLVSVSVRALRGHFSTHLRQSVHSGFFTVYSCIASVGQTLLHRLHWIHVSCTCTFTTLKMEKTPNKAPNGQITLHQNRSPSTATNTIIKININGTLTWVINVKDRVKITRGSEITSKLKPNTDSTNKNTKK